MPVYLQTVKKFYEEAFQTLDSKRPAPEIEVTFYPYIGINHTIRVRRGKVFVRISDILHDAPFSVQNALAYILVAKLLRKKIPTDARETYEKFVKSGEMREKAIENKRQKGRKIISSPQGEIYDLEQIFKSLNNIYFSERLAKPALSWSARKTFRRLGHYDSVHQTIIISKSLDDKKVPKFVVEYVVFHEMLHILHPTVDQNGRRYNHTPAFRRDEEKFARFTEAEEWVRRSAKFLKRGAGKTID